eukprot:gene1685-34599_t
MMIFLVFLGINLGEQERTLRGCKCRSTWKTDSSSYSLCGMVVPEDDQSFNQTFSSWCVLAEAEEQPDDCEPSTTVNWDYCDPTVCYDSDVTGIISQETNNSVSCSDIYAKGLCESTDVERIKERCPLSCNACPANLTTPTSSTITITTITSTVFVQRECNDSVSTGLTNSKTNATFTTTSTTPSPAPTTKYALPRTCNDTDNTGLKDKNTEQIRESCPVTCDAPCPTQKVRECEDSSVTGFVDPDTEGPLSCTRLRNNCNDANYGAEIKEKCPVTCDAPCPSTTTTRTRVTGASFGDDVQKVCPVTCGVDCPLTTAAAASQSPQDIQAFPAIPVVVAVIAILLIIVAVVIGLRCCNDRKEGNGGYDRGIILANPTFQNTPAVAPSNGAPAAAPLGDMMGGDAMYEVIPDAQPLSFTAGQAKPMMETTYMDQPASGQMRMPSSGYAEVSEATYAEALEGTYATPLGGLGGDGPTYDDTGVAAMVGAGSSGSGKLPPPIGSTMLAQGSYAEVGPFGGEATYDEVGIAAQQSGV